MRLILINVFIIHLNLTVHVAKDAIVDARNFEAEKLDIVELALQFVKEAILPLCHMVDLDGRKVYLVSEVEWRLDRGIHFKHFRCFLGSSLIVFERIERVWEQMIELGVEFQELLKSDHVARLASSYTLFQLLVKTPETALIRTFLKLYSLRLELLAEFMQVGKPENVEVYSDRLKDTLSLNIINLGIVALLIVVWNDHVCYLIQMPRKVQKQLRGNGHDVQRAIDVLLCFKS